MIFLIHTSTGLNSTGLSNLAYLLCYLITCTIPQIRWKGNLNPQVTCGDCIMGEPSTDYIILLLLNVNLYARGKVHMQERL